MSFIDLLEYVYLALGSTSLDEHDITILNNVVLTLGHDLTSGLNGSFVTKLLENTVVVHNSLDESLLKVTVDNTSSGGSLGALTDGPLTDLISTSGEEATQVQSSTHGSDNLGKARLGAKLLALLSSGSIITHQGKTLLEAGRDGQNGRTLRVLLDPVEQRGEVLVLLANVVLLAQVDQVHTGLGSQQEERVNSLNL